MVEIELLFLETLIIFLKIINFAHTTEHSALSDRTQTKELDYYNLDMIISVGYHVKSQNGVIFRKWTNGKDLLS